MVKCCFCPKTVEEGPLFRINEKGVPGIFACRECIRLSDSPPPDAGGSAEDMARLNAAIAEARRIKG